MAFDPLRTGASLEEYEAQATALLAGWHAEEPAAEQIIRTRHPDFMDPKIAWKPREMSRDEARAVPLDDVAARWALARWYDYADWSRLAAHVEAMADPASPLGRYERAVDAVVDGDVAALAAAIGEDADLVHARSARVTWFDPPVHAATLLHYIAANGVEQHRQRSPANAPDVARLLLDAGADPDSLAHLYGGQCTTLSLLVSSGHPAAAGVQVALVDVLADCGASLEPRGVGRSASPLLTALAYGYREAAEALVRRGARIDTLTAAAGLGRVDIAASLLDNADAAERHRAVALAAIGGQVGVLRLLLHAGEDPSRFNPPGFHAHTTPLHQAALAGHLPVVELLVERGARLDVRDTIWHGLPLGWARHGGQRDVAAYLESKGARDD